MNPRILVGKTVTAIALGDWNVDLTFMFNDGTALYFSFPLQDDGTMYGGAIGLSGLLALTGVASLLNQTITSVTVENVAKPAVLEGYEDLVQGALRIHAGSNSLLISYVQNAGATPIVLKEGSPIGTGLLTGDYVESSTFKNLWN